jgi:hypothetical protein
MGYILIVNMEAYKQQESFSALLHDKKAFA